MKERYIGIMSGTSLDGVDIVLCEIDSQSCTLISYDTTPFEIDLKQEILKMIESATTIGEVGRLDYKLGKFFAKCVNDFLEQTEYQPKSIEAIGLHGQTLWHEPESKTPFSMQLGNASVLAVETGIKVVSDFRSKDVALGGQGAPFAPAFHQFLFSHLEDCGVLNIGGMANISVLGDDLIGYDTGCGNVLMDMWTQEHKKLPFDKDGRWAREGEIHKELLDKFLEDDYFLLKFPKSTGREYFNKKFLIKNLEPFDTIAIEDVQRTLLALTVSSIVNELKQFSVKKLLVCGGGARNLFLMEQLKEALPKVLVESTQSYGVDADSMEAMIFAWLAQKRLSQEVVNLKSVTGARKNSILGAIYESD